MQTLNSFGGMLEQPPEFQQRFDFRICQSARVESHGFSLTDSSPAKMLTVPWRPRRDGVSSSSRGGHWVTSSPGDRFLEADGEFTSERKALLLPPVPKMVPSCLHQGRRGLRQFAPKEAYKGRKVGLEEVAQVASPLFVLAQVCTCLHRLASTEGQGVKSIPDRDRTRRRKLQTEIPV
jgi:hypothetical protein